ncbi:hypothetical protein B7P43_G09996 [Cryptotermes secundus]|uniref:Uncharacterized protein n=1 Tax=Cryptotermes secundus TaxID=105785 RepID=A0A2J7RH21_9NEOP|nr:hypothetical protein B7P43_G09996 [Cryptotermes secundus]
MVVTNLTMTATVTIPDQPIMDCAAVGRVGGTNCAIKSCVMKKHKVLQRYSVKSMMNVT